MIFTNVALNKNNVSILGKKIKGVYCFIACGGNMSAGLAFTTVGDTAGLAYFGDKNSCTKPQMLIDIFVRHCKEQIKIASGK